MNMLTATMSTPEIIIMNERYGKSEAPKEILHEEPDIVGHRTVVGSYETYTWTEKKKPNRVSRDPFLGLAVEAMSLKNGERIGAYYWKGNFLSYCSRPIHIVLDEFSRMSLEDFCQSVYRLENRIRSMALLGNPQYDLEIRRFLLVSEGMSNRLASRFLSECLKRISF